MFTTSLLFNPTYESDVLKKGTNSPGVSAQFGGTLAFTTAGAEGRPYDLIAFSTGSASARYPAYPSKSLNSFSTQTFYQYFLDALGYHTDTNGNIEGQSVSVTPTVKDIPPANLITVETVSFGFLNQAAFMPTYRSEIADLFTPQVTYGLQNINLSNGTCKPIYNPNGQASNAGFCYYVDLALTGGQTFSDVLTQENANIAASVTPGWRIPQSDWKLTLPTMATVRSYEDFVGGRQDLLLQSGPTFLYSPGPVAKTPVENVLLTFSLAVTYFKNYSTVAAAAWSGVIVQPTLTLAFQPPTPAH